MKLRYEAIDALRGLIMAVMAIDHINAFIARQHATEFWNGAVSIHSSWLSFLTRWVTHLCAPGFFFLMGAGACWWVASRRAAGWAEGQIARRLLLRGFAILLCGQVFETALMLGQQSLRPAQVNLARVPMPIPVDGSSVMVAVITLSGLGLVLMTCALLARAPGWVWLLMCAVSVVVTNTMLPASGLLNTLLFAPGVSNGVVVVYPPLPWLGVTAFGWWWGERWQRLPGARRETIWWGLGLVALAVAVRAAGGWGNLVPAREATLMEFLNNVKYPPSLVFWTMSVGLDLLLLAALLRWPGRVSEWLVVYGRAPLFFYLVHFVVLFVVARAFFPEAAPIGMVYVVWPLLLGVMYPLCRWYGNFKLQRPADSLWRIF